jgi:predicted kinase
MRRLPAEKSLAALLSNDGLLAPQAESIADYLARFYSSLPPALVMADEYCQALHRHASSNASALSEAFPESRRATGAQLRYLALQREQFAARVVAGRIVDGHGDLRPEHIYAEDPPVVIDCIEFSDELRRVDIADELAFLDMECERLGDGGFGKLVLAKYQHVSGDAISPAVESFYRGYRACVRAKVALLRSTQQADDKSDNARSVREYLDLANHYAAALGPPTLVMVGGLPGTGKSTLAQQVAATLGCNALSTDRMRRDLLGPSPIPLEFGAGRYGVVARQEIYNELFGEAARALSNGLSVVLDGTFNLRELRRRALEVARERSAVGLFVRCQCSRDVALERIAKRARHDSSASETRPEFYERQMREFELPERDVPSLTVETTAPLSDQVEVVANELKRRLFE